MLLQVKAEFATIDAVVIPDNIEDGDCYITVETPFLWGMQLEQKSTESAHQYYTPLAGDLDNDGISEIVAIATVGLNATVAVFEGNDLSKTNIISLNTEIIANTTVPIGLVRVPDEVISTDTIGLIIIRTNTDIRSYKYDDINNISLFKINNVDISMLGPISFADFNNDGKAEVYCGNMVYDVYSLDLIAKGTGNSGKAYFHGLSERISFAADVLPSISGTELICGAEIYSVNFNTKSLQLEKTIIPPAGFSSDGHTLVADFDNDGILDVLVKEDSISKYGLYAYNPITGSILFSKVVYDDKFHNFPQIGDIDADNKPEIILLFEDMLQAYEFKGSSLDLFWSLVIDDTSGSTGTALFDFNQDGKNEIIHRDEKSLRIIDGSTSSPNILLIQNNVKSGTVQENPIVVDCDADGEAEIITLGATSSGGDYINSKVQIYKSSSSKWAPARSIWNQYAYNITNVNKDLTIPSNVFNNATIFPNGKQPFNNFREQATSINPNGDPFYYILPKKYASLKLNVCDSYDFNGKVLTTSGLHKDTLMTVNGCDSIVSLDLTVYPSATSTDTVMLDCGGTYLNNGYVYYESGFFIDYLKTVHGCDSIVTNIIIDNTNCPDLIIPAFFTPNGDGVNDYFEIENLNFYSSAFVEIYDRYSKPIARFTSDEKGWDGSFNGNILPSTDYWYVIIIPEMSVEKVGHVLLKR